MLLWWRVGAVSSVTHCEPNEWQCKNGQCIRHRQLCDDYVHCDDGSDETPEQCKSVNFFDVLPVICIELSCLFKMMLVWQVCTAGIAMRERSFSVTAPLIADAFHLALSAMGCCTATWARMSTTVVSFSRFFFIKHVDFKSWIGTLIK